MTPPDREGDERLLSDWLRKAGTGELGDITAPVARTRQVLLDKLSPKVIPTLPTRIVRFVVSGNFIASTSALGMLLIGCAIVFMVVNHGWQPTVLARTASTLRDIGSYSYRLRWQSTWLEDDGNLRMTTYGDGMNYWRAPEDFHSEMTIRETSEDVATGTRSEKVIERFSETFPAGLVVDYVRKTYLHALFEPTGSRTYPWDVLRMIRDGSYDCQRDLGTKRIGDSTAHGMVLILKNPRTKTTVHDPVELWVDAQTGLPIEFSYRGKSAGGTYADRATDFRWNIKLDSKLFERVPPEGFADITPPTDERALTEIAESLQLFAKLDDGRYPRANEFDAAGVLAEMKTLAGFTGPMQPQWADDPTYREIEAAAPGLGWIERVLRLRFNSGYHGAKVTAADKNRVLLWWLASENRYRVYYGDLRTEVLSEASWSKLVPDATSTDSR